MLQITLTWQTITTAVGIVGAFVALVTYLKKLFGWFDRQKMQDKEIKDIKEELTLLTYGIQACLKGLKEQGCDGPVTDAIDKIDKHLNKKAHGG